MKRILTIGLLTSALVFTGCTANKGLGLGGSTSTVKQAFEKGNVVSSNKVLIDEGNLTSTLTGAGVGAGVGALVGSRSGSKNALVGGAIGAGVGAIGGYVANTMTGGNEVEAYEVQIESHSGKNYKTYLKNDLPQGTLVEFVVREGGEITNIDVKKMGKAVNR